MQPKNVAYRANGHGPHACGPYKPPGDGRGTGKAGAGRKGPRRKQAANRVPGTAPPQGPSGCSSCFWYSVGGMPVWRLNTRVK